MSELMEVLARAIGGSWPLALGSAFVWGVLSILLSPCHLASIPLIVGFIGGQGRITTRRAALLAALFSAGILVTIAAIGLVTALAGRMLGDVGRYGYWLVSLVFFLVGLHLLDVIPMPGSGPGDVGLKRKGGLAAFILGLVFGIALGPCTFAFMAPMVAVAFAVGTNDQAFGAVLLLAYGIGHSAVITLAGTFTELVQRYLNWNERSRGLIWLRRACGALIILAGLYLLSIAP
jgi:cytochrome c-type biogenesis protein